ncbi:MAG TPA: signal peptidase I, partial [Acidimicrobiales bacterium]|nr:signal peptidase I [Acidimicrobiales bacterium]
MPEVPPSEADDAAPDPARGSWMTSGRDTSQAVIGTTGVSTGEDPAIGPAFGPGFGSGTGQPEQGTPVGNGTSAGATGRGRPRSDRWWRQLVEWVAVAAVALLIAVLLRSYVVQTFYVPSGSMLPTLQIGDRIIVNKLHGPIHRFDIIVFRRTPGDRTT